MSDSHFVDLSNDSRMQIYHFLLNSKLLQKKNIGKLNAYAPNFPWSSQAQEPWGVAPQNNSDSYFCWLFQCSLNGQTTKFHILPYKERIGTVNNPTFFEAPRPKSPGGSTPRASLMNTFVCSSHVLLNCNFIKFHLWCYKQIIGNINTNMNPAFFAPPRSDSYLLSLPILNYHQKIIGNVNKYVSDLGASKHIGLIRCWLIQCFVVAYPGKHNH